MKKNYVLQADAENSANGEIFSLFKENGQEHVFKYFDSLSKDARARFLKELSAVDFSTLSLWNRKAVADTGTVCPIEALSLKEIDLQRETFQKKGEEIIRRGALATVLLAGGQGTRLGSNLPKGMFDVGLTKHLYLFELLIDHLLNVSKACGAYPYLFVMTSEKNDFVTREFFMEHSFFGYPKEKVRFFRQKMAPCVDLQGKLLLEEKGRLARSPNGNGGWYESLLEAGFQTELQNIEWFNVFSVDNVLQNIADPVFLGAAVLRNADCAAKGVKKRDPAEKVGVLCLKNGVPTVIEYYELDEERANLRDENGGLVYSFGMTLNYLFRADALRKIASREIPVHVVRKKIPCLNGDGAFSEPTEANGYKFETLILDMIGMIGNCLPFEVEREKEFAPIKNMTGADSVDTARALLQKNGVAL